MSNPTSNSIGLSEAASRFEAYLDSAPADNPPASPAAPASNAAETEDTVEAPAADDAAIKTPPSDNTEDDSTPDLTLDADNDETVTDEDGDAADDATADDETDDDQAPQAPQSFTVKINGKEETVELKELLSGYSRTADYTRSKMALADEKKAFEPEVHAVKLERQQYSQLLPALVDMLKEGFAEPDWDALADNPTEYIRQERLWRERNDRITAAQQEQERLNTVRENEAKAEMAHAIRNSGAELVKSNPQWKNPQTWAADRAKLIDYGKVLGFSEAELKQTYDHRAIIALDKARRYDELMAKRPKPAPSNGPKPIAAGSAPQQKSRQTSDFTRAKQRLAKTGSVRDAATIFEQLF
ncbi:hypothetical protein [Rhizobium favelukesii]|uniref:Conserved protein n=1 Tax=Rhizobium favelukesii TaxID=348824 RepID=W6RFB2_9HYPH|nr:hypothetical protein [Rhizobium favelukesii]MCS0459316.1 hypothetical protein [Rhizobium favelukesii]CDM57383.1 putative conserved protein [Rhizobium favelukesii]